VDRKTSRAFLRPRHVFENAMPPPIQHFPAGHALHAHVSKHLVDPAFKRLFFRLAEIMRCRVLGLVAPAGLRYVASRRLRAPVVSIV
jgi:hypothetical protein